MTLFFWILLGAFLVLFFLAIWFATSNLGDLSPLDLSDEEWEQRRRDDETAACIIAAGTAANSF